MRRLLLALAVPIVTSGCILTPTQTLDAAPCQSGPGDLFLGASWGGGFSSPGELPYLYSIDRQGDFFEFRGSHARQGYEVAPGSGQIHAPPGALHNVTVDQVRQELERLDRWDASRDYNVTLALRVRLEPGVFAGFCSRILADFYGLESFYPDDGCFDGSTLNFTISTERGVATSAAYCQGGSADFNRVREAFFELMGDTRDQVGVPRP